jgi:hypothetical protein
MCDFILNHLLEFKVALFPGSPPLLGKLGGFWTIFLPWSPIGDASQPAMSLRPAKNLTESIFPRLAID